MLDQIIPRLLEGQFICETTAPALFRSLADETLRAEVDAYLGKIKRRLTITPNGQAYYASWVKVGKEQRAEAKRVMVSIKQMIRPVISSLSSAWIARKLMWRHRPATVSTTRPF